MTLEEHRIMNLQNAAALCGQTHCKMSDSEIAIAKRFVDAKILYWGNDRMLHLTPTTTKES